MATCWGVIKDGRLEFHIPSAIKEDQGLTDKDVAVFSIDSGSLIISDNGKELAAKQGDYPVESREKDLVVLIDLE